MKKWASEDNLIYHRRRNGTQDVQKIEFWDLLYPQHPIKFWKPIIDFDSKESVFCLGCEESHNKYVDCSGKKT